MFQMVMLLAPLTMSLTLLSILLFWLHSLLLRPLPSLTNGSTSWMNTSLNRMLPKASFLSRRGSQFWLVWLRLSVRPVRFWFQGVLPIRLLHLLGVLQRMMSAWPSPLLLGNGTCLRLLLRRTTLQGPDQNPVVEIKVSKLPAPQCPLVFLRLPFWLVRGLTWLRGPLWVRDLQGNDGYFVRGSLVGYICGLVRCIIIVQISIFPSLVQIPILSFQIVALLIYCFSVVIYSSNVTLFLLEVERNSKSKG